MSVREIISAPDERLKIKSVPVLDFNSVTDLVQDLLDTMYSTSDGIGLAAPQIGRLESVLVIDISDDRNNPIIMINPKITSKSGRVSGQEGCLSLPGFYSEVSRYKEVTVQALGVNGKEFYIKDDGFLSIVMQHEIDHLNGIIFIDHLSRLKQERAINKLNKHNKHKNKLPD
jgi:peptide deformylase